MGQRDGTERQKGRVDWRSFRAQPLEIAAQGYAPFEYVIFIISAGHLTLNERILKLWKSTRPF